MNISAADALSWLTLLNKCGGVKVQYLYLLLVSAPWLINVSAINLCERVHMCVWLVVDQFIYVHVRVCVSLGLVNSHVCTSVIHVVHATYAMHSLLCICLTCCLEMKSRFNLSVVKCAIQIKLTSTWKFTVAESGNTQCTSYIPSQWEYWKTNHSHHVSATSKCSILLSNLKWFKLCGRNNTFYLKEPFTQKQQW